MKNKIWKSILLVVMAVCCVSCFTACDSNFVNGKSAYDVAVDNGFAGSETEWIESLKGDNADVLVSFYQEAQDDGYTGSYYEFLTEYIKGDKGDSGDCDTVPSAFNKGIKSVVSVYCGFTKTVTSGGFFEPTTTNDVDYVSAGSGVIYQLDKDTGDAIIITNYHVVYSAESNTDSHISNDINLFVYGKELQKYAISGTVIGGSLNYDIALIKVTNNEILKNGPEEAVTVSSSPYYTADSIIALGNPEGEGIAATSGIISVESEYISMTGADEVSEITFREIRIDSAINGGNSGGGLFNASGDLIGIVNAKAVDEEIEGMGYAIPYTTVINIADNLIKNYNGTDISRAQKVVLGLTTEVSDSYSIYDETTNRTKTIETITIYEVSENSFAKTAGFMAGDILKQVTFNGKTYNIDRDYTLSELCLPMDINENIEFIIERDGQEKTLTLIATGYTSVA